MPELYIGLMSGTSLDGVDGVLADFEGGGLRVLAHAGAPFDPRLKAELLALNRAGPDEIHRSQLAANALMRVYAQVVRELLARAGLQAGDVRAIGAHGQTVRHRPQAFDGTGYTVQLAQPALLAELAGIEVVADFRSRDVAAGGQGAPLAPFFHRALFARAGEAVGVLNIGGMSNLTVLRADGSQLGFDCGPGNALMDGWCQRHTGQAYDDQGAWAAGAPPDAALLQALLAEPFFAMAPPKSTGRDLFDAPWLDRLLQPFGGLAPQQVQATLAELTAASCAQDVQRHAPDLPRLIVCGGGALNAHLMRRLQDLLPATRVLSSDDAGLPPLQVEAAAFAWLARKAVRREPLALESTTGARGARVLGGIWPA
ncbi:anhydro-N-acetylmuramic acid kinase [Ramlibacter tataouinensis]|uniref:anhydro-N-acetylmuramic acid kinase n=1 Tax=Ramlibacter tataouinensis TaxID=94132 RepID=UPI0022F3C19F|nr:anhydro-N-acetylmuramic acid kinase [Ramlibacter tataouinensis]WBY03645.1 anhydro-N-acetylmuramic acid kinase [Ramlibacter tataouinensis]